MALDNDYNWDDSGLDEEILDDIDDLDEDYLLDDFDDEDPFEKARLEEKQKRREMRKKDNKNSRGYRKRRQQTKMFITGVFAALLLVALLAVSFLYKRYAPTKECMSGYTYFEVENTGKVMIILDGEQHNDAALDIEGRVYVPYDYVTENINVRFYYDNETDAVLYTTSQTIYTFADGQKEYTDSEGNKSEAAVAVMRKVDGEVYLDFEFVAGKTNCSYAYGEEPKRVVISTKHNEISCVTARKNLAVRYRAGNKSEILEDIKNGDKMIFLREIDDKWSEVKTATGITGYVRNSAISEVFSEIPQDTYVEEYNCISSDKKITMAWFQIGATAANSYIDEYMSKANGYINTISPTWYSISSANGSVSSLASKDFVNRMHAKGIEVWPLIDDFNKNVDYAALFSSRQARTNLVNKIISEAQSIGFDGINLDFEYVKDSYAKDYLQFVRELSIACEKNNLVLSTDNYKPAPYNSFYNLKEQASFVDYVIIMGYDEHYAGSQEAGSVASLPFVREGIKDTTQMVPASQVINALPFFTRIWTVKSSSVTSTAVDMQVALNSIKGKTNALWSDETGQYIAEYKTSGSTVKVWLEEERSIEEKMKVVKEYNLAGVSAWKLSMEKDGIWEVISKYNQ